jgi:hypothetical protein
MNHGASSMEETVAVTGNLSLTRETTMTATSREGD